LLCSSSNFIAKKKIKFPSSVKSSYFKGHVPRAGVSVTSHVMQKNSSMVQKSSKGSGLLQMMEKTCWSNVAAKQKNGGNKNIKQ